MNRLVEYLSAGGWTVNPLHAERWSRPTLMVKGRWDDADGEFRLDDPHLFVWEPPYEVFQAWAFQRNINPFQRGLRDVVYREIALSRPCRGCGTDAADRLDPHRCDRCLMAVVIDRERARQGRELAAERRAAAGQVVAGLPAHRRRLVELCGGPIESAGQVFAEAYGEW